jgi:ApaG protein
MTRNIRIRVESRHDPERSDLENERWFFVYTIRISNEGPETVQLISRHWIITDADGEVEEVRGPGVVGEQPVLEPDQSFEYHSGCPLGTAFGTMHGTYQMVTLNGEHFDVEIAPFALSLPYAIN